MLRRLLVAGIGTASMVALVATAAHAQPGAGSSGWGPGMMMGPGMMGGGGLTFMCNPRLAGLAEWRMDRIEAIIRPNDAQRSALNGPRAASTKAAESISATCAGAVPAKATDRLALMEKRMDTMLTAIKTVRPAFEKLYDLLDDDQHKRLDTAGPRRWGWNAWHWRWN